MDHVSTHPFKATLDREPHGLNPAIARFPDKIAFTLWRREIFVANFIPPVNWASQGNYFLPKKSYISLKKALAAKCANFFKWFLVLFS